MARKRIKPDALAVARAFADKFPADSTRSRIEQKMLRAVIVARAIDRLADAVRENTAAILARRS